MYMVFDFHTISPYLIKIFGDKSLRKGLKSKAAKAVGCHSTLMSQIVHGKVVPSLEVAEKISKFLQHSEEERHFFILMVQSEKAGTKDLKDYFKRQMASILKDREVLKKRLGKVDSISEEDELRYYSNWQYSAVHILTSINQYSSAEKISEYLKIDLIDVKEILAFLRRLGLVNYDNQNFLKIGTKHIHLGNDSALIKNHHTNWRLKSIHQIDKYPTKNFHYSSVFSLSKKDIGKIKEIFFENLTKINAVVKQSEEETISCLNFDFFEI